MRTGTFLLVGVAFLAAYKVGEVRSPLARAHGHFLTGEWSWTDSMTYSGYVPAGESIPHRGVYILDGTATLEPTNATSHAAESYILSATASLMHVDSTGESNEVASWIVPDLAFDDTVEVANDTIFNLSVEPIPPEAIPNPNRIRWLLRSDELWCTKWLKDAVQAGNADLCQTVVTWNKTNLRRQ